MKTKNKILAAIVMLLLVFGVTSCGGNKQGVTYQNYKSIVVSSDVDDSAIAGQAQLESMDEAYSLSVADMPKYHVIVASFKQSVPANKALDDFLRNGYSKARLLDDEKGRIRVAVASFVNKEDALTALTDYKKQPLFKDAWVLTSR